MPNSVTHFSRYNYEDTYYNNSTNSNYGWNIFENCYNLKKLHLSEGLTVVPFSMAYGCSSLEDVNIPKNSTIIEERAFYNTKSLKSIELPESLYSINLGSFRNSGIESLMIPKNVASIGQYAFADCENLKNIVLNSHCHDMDYTLSNCTSLESVELPCATPPSITNDPFSGLTKSNIKLIIPDFAKVAYGIDNYWCNFTNQSVGDEASKQDYWAIRGNLTLDKDKKMQGTPSVEIFTGGSLTLDTDLNQSFNDFTYYTKETKPATFLNKSSSITANSLTTRYYVETADKWFFFSPVCDVNMSDVTYPNSESWIIRYYDGERRGTQNTNSGNWKNVPSDGVLRRGQGYIIQAKATGWLNMPVTKENQNIFFDQKELTMSLANNPSESEVNAGWNFVSNPYPCYYDVYFMNMQAPITVWTGSTYRAYALNEGDNGDDTYVLRPMQPFFVQKSSADLTAVMPLVGRQVNTTINHSRAPKPNTTEANPLRNLLNLELIKNGSDEADDYTRVVINEQASMDYERACDASKFMSMDATVAQFFTLGEDETPMAINERPYDNGNVALGVYFPEAGETFTITATRSDRQTWIYDAETGIEQDLTEGDYTFMVNKTGYDYNRFSIRFSPVTNAVEKTENVKVKVNAGAGYISVVASEDANVSVYGTDGRVVASCMGSNNFTVPAGVYVIRVDGQTFKTIVK
ncbi:MAG: leucine-rich repeat domain-containing protein [Muribaculum sp.]|nr:leucine-rich repeat domain-containing protein [Muribaculum sp.]